MQWLLDSFYYPALPLFSISHSYHYPLHILEYNVPEELGQLPLRFLLPHLHKAAITFRGRRAPPSEVTHSIRPVFSLLLAQLDLWLRADPPLWTTSSIQVPFGIILVTGQLPAGLRGETALRGAPSLQRGGKDLYRPAFSARGFTPAEMLHWIGASLVVVGSQIRLWYLVFQGGQKDAE